MGWWEHHRLLIEVCLVVVAAYVGAAARFVRLEERVRLLLDRVARLEARVFGTGRGAK